MALMHKKERGPDYFKNLTSYTEHAYNLGDCVVPETVLTKYTQATANLIPGRLQMGSSSESTNSRSREQELAEPTHTASRRAIPSEPDSSTLRNSGSADGLSSATLSIEDPSPRRIHAKLHRPRPTSLTTTELVRLFEARSASTSNSTHTNSQRSPSAQSSRGSLSLRDSTHRMGDRPLTILKSKLQSLPESIPTPTPTPTPKPEPGREHSFGLSDRQIIDN